MSEHTATVGRTLHQVAALVPNRKGSASVCSATILRRVAPDWPLVVAAGQGADRCMAILAANVALFSSFISDGASKHGASGGGNQSMYAGALDERYAALTGVMAADIPGAVTRIIGDAGHAAHLERPDEFGGIVSSFLHNITGE